MIDNITVEFTNISAENHPKLTCFFVFSRLLIQNQITMKISYNWLNEFLPITYTPEQLDQILTDTGLEVEGFETLEAVKGGLEGVIVAEVVSCEQHPNADRLKVTKVNTGTEILQVVCGAPNVAIGQKVILAQVGAVLYPTPDQPLKMKVSKIRDVESYGMLCAEDELGLGTSHDGIMVLAPDAPIGMPAATFLELENDVQIEIGLTPNRADAMGHIGVARDVLAYRACHENTNDKLELKPVSSHEVTAELPISVEVKDSDKCPRYMGVSITNVHVKASPAWLQKRLRAVGLTPINNVVDVTNYVMRELGTPLHAFDGNSVNGKVIIRTAKSNEKITTLDGVERTLHEEDLIIANESAPLCIAGVFGGMHSGITEQSTSVFLEAAYFQPVSVRKTAKRHGLNTDASFRFERGVDIDLVPYALNRAVDLIVNLTGGEVAMKTIDTYENPVQNRTITLRYNRCHQIIGHELPKETIRTILTALDFNIVQDSETECVVTVPNYRVDVDREIDIIEELLRIYGFNQIPLPEKLNTSIIVGHKPDVERLMINLSEVLAGFGFHEMMNNSLTSPVYIDQFGKMGMSSANHVRMLNPLSQDLAVMRQSLVFQGLETVAHNQNRQRPDVRLFEFGKTYCVREGNYIENKRLTLFMSGRKTSESWNSTAEKVSLFTLKGIVNGIIDRLGFNQLVVEEPMPENDLLADGYQIRILKQVVGQVGWVKKEVKKHFGVKNEVYVADLDWDALIGSLKLVKVQYKELPKTFAVRRDFSLLLDTAVSFERIVALAKKVDKKLLQSVGLFDVYEGKNLPEGKKSYAVSFVFQDAENTLKDEQVDKLMDSIRISLETEIGAELRS
jgi:phenylalanyl-tRNA synthetase beta chain